MKSLLPLLPVCLAFLGCELWTNLDSFHVGGAGTGATGAGGGTGATGGAGNTGATGGQPCVPVDDHNPCTDDVCEGGAPVHKPVAARTPCSDGGTMCDAEGKCVDCLAPEDCPGTDGECQTRVCEAGSCSFSYTPVGTATSEQVAGDCVEKQCDGEGEIVPVVDEDDTKDDGKPCTDDLCDGATLEHPPKAVNTPCGAGLKCDGAGKCVGCFTADDCPGPNTECQAPSCDMGTCGVWTAAQGAPVLGQTTGDCKKNQCDGEGWIETVPDDPDVFDDGNPCTDDTCLNGVPQAENTTIGTACGPGLVCDGNGVCVGCISAADCSNGGNPCLDAVCNSGTCGTTPKTNGTACDDGNGCTANDACQSGTCTGAQVCPSCVGAAKTCGPDHDESCCSSKLVTGGTFDRGNEPASPATVSNFRLDRFEITVRRFRKFVQAYPGSAPSSGDGAHPGIAGSGWLVPWPMPGNATDLANSLKCNASFQTWTDAPGANEDLPLNCLGWFEAFAFCAWDGGFLPTEAEWNFAAAGGGEQREYPWGATSPNGGFAVYACTGDGSAAGACAFTDILPGGSRSPLGDGKWTQTDLAGSMWEWNLDYYAWGYSNPCNNCANLTSSSTRVMRGGGWTSNASFLGTFIRNYASPSTRNPDVGARCARVP